MPFNVEEARKAGYSDDEILSHLTQSRKFDVAGAVKSGYSKQDIISHLAGTAPVAATRASAPPQPPAEQPGALQRLGSALYDATIGGIVGAAEAVVNWDTPLRRGAEATGAVLRTKQGTPEREAALQQWTKAPISNPFGYTPGPFADPALQATQQAGEGNVAGAVGTLVGAYGAPAATVGALKGAKAGVRAAKASIERVNPNSAMFSALKPKSTNVTFPQALERAMPEIKAAEAEIGRPISGVADLIDGVKAAKARVWGQLEEIAGPQMTRGVDGSLIADSIVNSIPKKLRLENPAAVQAIETMANKYRATFTIQELENFLQETNAELQAYYNKYPGAQRASLKSNPETAHTVAQAEALRTIINKSLDGAGDGAAVAELKQRYGALRNVEDEAFRRKNVAERQNPDSLSEQLGKWHATGKMVGAAGRALRGDIGGAAVSLGEAVGARKAAMYMKELNTADSLIKRAFEQYNGSPAPINYTPVTPRALLGEGPIRMGGIPDPSGIVRDAPGPTILTREPITDPSRLLPAGRRTLFTPPPADPSGVRTVRGRFANDPPANRLLPPASVNLNRLLDR